MFEVNSTFFVIICLLPDYKLAKDEERDCISQSFCPRKALFMVNISVSLLQRNRNNKIDRLDT